MYWDLEDFEVKFGFKVEVVYVLWKLVVGYVKNCKFIIDICVFLCFVKLMKYSGGEFKYNFVMVVKEIVVVVGRDFEFCWVVFKINLLLVKVVVE